MKCNVGKKDQTLRLAMGLLIIAAGLYFQNWLGAIGVVLVLTGLFRWCPAYIPFRISTK